MNIWHKTPLALDYKLKAWNRGENILLDINENYWGNKAKLAARIEIGAEPDVECWVCGQVIMTQ